MNTKVYRKIRVKLLGRIVEFTLINSDKDIITITLSAEELGQLRNIIDAALEQIAGHPTEWGF